MYDPLVVDTFFGVHKSIAPEGTGTQPSHEILNGIASARGSESESTPGPPFENPSTAGPDILSIHELARALAGYVSVTDAADIIARHLDRLIPSSLCVFYVHDCAVDELVAKHVTGADALAITGIRIPLGQRLSGWVAANRQTILNSDPALDFNDKTTSIKLRLHSCLSTPLVSDGKLIGVLSLYSGSLNGFTEEHRRIVEVLGHQIALTLKRASEFDSNLRRDLITGLPSVTQLERLIGTEPTDPGFGSIRYSLLFINILNLSDGTCIESTSDRNEVIRHVALRIQHGLRFADILFRNSGDCFVAFLNQTDRDTGDLVGEQICDRIRRNPIRLSSGTSFSVDVTAMCVCASRDGDSFGELEAAASTREFQPTDVQLTERSLVH